MKNRIGHLLMVLCLMVSLLSTAAIASSVDSTRAATTDFYLVFSNIGKGGTSASPPTSNTKSVVAKSISPGYTMVKLSDLKYMGATVQKSGTKYYVTINGQTITFTEGSTYYSSSTEYEIKNPADGTKKSYKFSVSGSTETGTQAQLIDGLPYVRLTDAAYQAGALFVNYNSVDSSTYVFDFRVNGNTALADSNTYIVGGSWLNSWSSKGTTQLSPNFKVNELWDDGSRATGTHENQLKTNVASLQAEENVRYHYNDGNSMNVTSGFRCWPQNQHDGGDPRSLHMRGRAIDATAAAGRAQTERIYNHLYDEFCGSSSTPISSGISWLSRADTSTSISGAYDLEKMPHDGGMWIHLGVKPAYLDAN